MSLLAFDPLTENPNAADRRAVSQFVEVGWRIQRNDPARVPDAQAKVHSRLEAAHPFFEHGEARFWVVEDSAGRAVGRIAAFANAHALDPDDDGRQLGYLGMYEADDDVEIARQLIDVACEWLRTVHNVRRVIGPMDGSTWYTYRFSDPTTHHLPPLWLEPRTADHYPAQWEACGFAPIERYLSMRTNAADERRSSKLDALADAGYTFRNVNLDRWNDELRLVYDMSIVAFADNPAYTPISWEEFAPMYAGVDRVIDPQLVQFVHGPDDAAAGFLFCIPNYIRSMLRMNGRGGVRGSLAFLANRRHANSVLVKTMATLPEHRSVGLGGALRTYVTDAAKASGRTEMLQMLMHADNHTLAAVERLDGGLARRYILFARELD